MDDATAIRDEEGPRKEYVRTFLFSMRLGAPLSRLHVITKFVGILILSLVVVRVMDEGNPDPVMAALLFALALLALHLGGVSRWLFRSYMVILFPMFLFLFITWVAFTPELGRRVYFQLPLYSGVIHLGISFAITAFLAVLIGHYILTKKIARGLFLGLLAALLISRFTPNPGLVFASVPFMGPYTFILSDQNLLVAGTKVLGYAAMVFMTLLLVMTTRDNELTAALRQVHVPYLGRFFLGTVFRSLSLSLMDFETIRQAQVARGIRMRRMNIIGVLRNTALMSIPLVATMLRRSSEIGDALQARGFNLSKQGREFLEVQPFRALDALILLFLAGLALLVTVFSFNLYRILVR